MTKKLSAEEVYHELMRERALNDKLRKRIERFAAVIDLAVERINDRLPGKRSAQHIKKELFDKINGSAKRR